jgi:hypothetical protein
VQEPGLDIVSVSLSPDKTDTPLIVDADGVLPGPRAFQHLKTIAWWHAQIIEPRNSVDQKELHDGAFCDVRRH